MTLLVGTATTGQATAQSDPAAEADLYRFVAVASGVMATMTVRTSAVVSTATSVIFLAYADSGSAAGSLLQAVTMTGTPPMSSDYTASGFTVNIVSGTAYWLGTLPLGGALASTFTSGTGLPTVWRTGLAAPPDPWGTNSGSATIASYPIRGDDAPTVVVPTYQPRRMPIL